MCNIAESLRERPTPLEISRYTLFPDSMDAILSHTFNYFSPLRVEFLGESGIGLGVLREWFQKVSNEENLVLYLQISSALKDSNTSIFKLCPNGRALEPDYTKPLNEGNL